jgi:hypothetical protein
MKPPQTGGCQCRKIRYEITEAPTLVYTATGGIAALDEQRLLLGDRRGRGRLPS